MEASTARHDSLFDSGDLFPKPDLPQTVTFFSLPAELRTCIYDLVFQPAETYAEAFNNQHDQSSPSELWDDYRASSNLALLLTCRTIYEDAHLLAFSRILFVVKNPYTTLNIADRLVERLRAEQVRSIRHVAFVADARHFRKLHHWRGRPFGIQELRLQELTVVLHRSNYWHYLFDFNVALVALLRDFQTVNHLTFVGNNALVKGTLHTWFNRLVLLILKTDLTERSVGREEKSWWIWRHEVDRHTVRFSRAPPKKSELGPKEYEEYLDPVWKALWLSMETEVEDEDPMSRV